MDSTLNSSAMESLLLGVEDELLGDEVPRYVEGQAEFLGEANDELLGADLVPRAFEVQDDDFPPLLVNRQRGQGGSGGRCGFGGSRARCRLSGLGRGVEQFGKVDVEVLSPPSCTAFVSMIFNEVEGRQFLR